ncbi:hypothetical protein PRIPAC_76326 [Pristionchus pacificus]|uniref:ShK domain-containing protein n=1 Tax=Pristionchus pacificus TaxID=54126 RepID=A0A2A6C8B3_PRIPA|nr:hypothetical protein PRIPAC_76326 [Pristionchus pacificus]|eukprot:PDM74399.1 ShK domain-containing protein [Pristionchus pacificus]
MSPVSTTLIATLFTLMRSVDLEEYDQVCMDYSRDCERRADLCFTKVELMHRSCPKTCQVCTPAAAAAAAPPTVAAPPTSALSRAYAPTMAAAAATRTKKEPVPERPSASAKSRRPSKKCRDIASDCDETADLCDHASFKKMMKKQCAKTCGFCHPGRSTSSSSRSRAGNSGGGGGEGDVLTISGLAGEVGDLPKSKSSSKGAKSKSIDGLNISELVKLIRKAEETTETQIFQTDAENVHAYVQSVHDIFDDDIIFN